MNFIVCLSLRHEILGNVCIVMIFFPVCDVMNFQINFKFLVKPFFYLTEKVITKI